MLNSERRDAADDLEVEEVDQQPAQRLQLKRVLPLGSREEEAGFRIARRPPSRVGESAQRSVRIDPELKHVQDVVIKAAAEHKVVWSLLRVGAEGEQAGVVLLTEELKRSRVFERMHRVMPPEVHCMRLLKEVEIGEGRVDECTRLLTA